MGQRYVGHCRRDFGKCDSKREVSMKKLWCCFWSTLWLAASLSLGDSVTNLEMTVARQVVDWIELQQETGVPNGVIVSTIRTNEDFVASNVWEACFDFTFDTNSISTSVNGYGRRVNVAICLRPFCGIETTPSLLEAYTRFCDIGSSYSFGMPGVTNSAFAAHTNDLAVLKQHFLKLMRNGPFFRKVWPEE